MIDRLVRDIQALDIIHDFRDVAVALSGGIDSVVLLALTVRALGSQRVIAIHVNHHTRPESDADATWCRNYGASLGVPVYICDIEKPHANFQDEARVRRYAAIRRAMYAAGATTLLTAHHANDRLETALFRLSRGTNASGMTALRQFTYLWGTPVCRPLLPYPKSIIHDCAAKLSLHWRQDSSNNSDTYARNDIRHNIIPNLTASFGLDAALRTIDHLEEDALMLEEANASLLETARTPYFDRRAHRLERQWLDRLSKMMKRRVLYQFFQELRLSPTAQQIESIMELSKRTLEPKVVEIPGAEVTISASYYTVRRTPVGERRSHPIEISVPIEGSQSYLWFDKQVVLAEADKCDSGNKVLAVEAGKLVLDGVRPGATLVSHGRTLRVMDLLRGASVSPEDRWYWPCLYIGLNCVAVVGVRCATLTGPYQLVVGF